MLILPSGVILRICVNLSCFELNVSLSINGKWISAQTDAHTAILVGRRKKPRQLPAWRDFPDAAPSIASTQKIPVAVQEHVVQLIKLLVLRIVDEDARFARGIDHHDARTIGEEDSPLFVRNNARCRMGLHRNADEPAENCERE